MATYKVEKKAKQTHMFDNEKDARAKAKQIGGKYVKGTGKSAGKHAAIKEDTQMKTFQSIREAANAAQQAAIAIAKKEKGEKPQNEGKRGFIKAAKDAKDKGEKTFTFAGKTYNCEDALDENVLKKAGSAMKKVASPVTNRLTRAGRAGIAQKKIDKHNTKVSQQDTIKKANDAGKSAFGLTRKSRAANAQKKLDKIAKKKAQQDTINKAKNLQKGVSAGMEYEGKKMDPAAMKRAMDAFKKRGGKIKKVAPGKAAGYHGKDDPGDNVHGMMDRGDTKGMPRKKKIGSMK